MITPAQRAEIRRLYFGEHWKLGTIAAALGIHHETVRAALQHETGGLRRGVSRSSALDPFLPFIRDTLTQYPRLRATRLHEMLRLRGYPGSAVQVRRLVRRLRPQTATHVYRRVVTLVGEQAQVDWGTFGTVRIGHGVRTVSGFVMVLGYSRALFALFTLDQTLESFLRGHVAAFEALGGSARTLVYDNLRSAVLDRRGTAIQFHPRLLELAGHYHFAPRPCTPARGNEKGKVERQERQRRSIERRLTAARLGRFKPLADWDWNWPTALDRPALDRVLALDFLDRAENVLLVGAQGLGKTMLAKNIVHQVVLAGHSARFITASDLLLDLNGQETARALERRLRHYARPALLAIDEIGYLAYDAHAADLLFQIVSRRYEHRPLLMTTNLAFKHWDTIFPNASCAVALIDRLTHHAEIVVIEGDSYRKREAELSQKQRRTKTRTRR